MKICRFLTIHLQARLFERKNKIDAIFVMDSQYVNRFVYSTHLLYQTYSILSRMSYKKIRHHFCAGSSDIKFGAKQSDG